MAQAPPPRNNTMLIIAILLLAAAGFAFWWFSTKKAEEEEVPIQSQAPTIDKSKYIGKMYGNVDLSTIYYILDMSTAKILNVGEACKNVSWSVSDVSMTIGDRKFTLGTDSISDSQQKFDELTGPIDQYCALLGTAV